MKPWEETWMVFEANKGFPAFAAEVGPHEVRVFESHSGDDDDIPRAKLAAAAPEMARLLAKIRQTYVPDDAAAKEIIAVLEKAGALDALPDWARNPAR